MQRLAQKRGQAGVLDAAPQTLGSPPQLPEQCQELQHELVDVVGAAVRQAPLHQRPHPLVRVEFWSVGREVLEVQARVAPQQLDQRTTLVGLGAIQDGDDRPAKVAQEMAEEERHAGLTDVLKRELVVQAKTLTLRTDRDRRDDRNPIVPLTVAVDGRLTSRRPSPQHGGNQEETRFVRKDEVGTQPCGVFFTRGQVLRFQRSMARSSRSTARRSGFWWLQLRLCMSRPTWSR